MPHNLYLHSSLVRYRSQISSKDSTLGEIADLVDPDIQDDESNSATSPLPRQSEDDNSSYTNGHDIDCNDVFPIERSSLIPRFIYYSNLDSVVALSGALLVNCAILIVAGATMYGRNRGGSEEGDGVAELTDAHDLLVKYLGPSAGVAFAIALV